MGGTFNLFLPQFPNSMKLFFLLPCLLLLQHLNAQKLLKGIVLDAERNAPVSKASIFLSNTSVGTMANDEGRFQLYVPAGKFDLIVSSIGYSTFSAPINATEITDSAIVLKLKLKAPDLEEIVIEPYEKDGWQKWGKWFTDNFIGTSEYSRDCRIVNPEVLKFRNSKKSNALLVVAIAPLLIENNAFGYRVTYQLESFHFDFKTHYLLYTGYPFFEAMQGSDRKQRAWEKNREDAFSGSMLQFMRALYRNRLAQEGFEVRRLQKFQNAEKERVRMVYKRSMAADNHGRIISTINSDSTAYYNRIMKEADYKSSIGNHLLSGDSIAYAIDSTLAGLDFPDYLLVTYKNKSVPYEFKQLYPKSNDAVMSEITLINSKPVEVLANGSYFNPEDLLSNGYWAWWEKIGTMLPFDYQQPPKK